MAEDSPPELQNSKEDNGITDLLPLGVKILEVIFSVFAIGLIVDPFNSFQQVHEMDYPRLSDVGIIYVTIAGYILINTVIIIGYLLGDRIPKKTALLFSAVGAVLFVASGSVIVHDWMHLRGTYVSVRNNARLPSKQYMDMLISAAFFTFVNAAVFVADVFVTYQYS